MLREKMIVVLASLACIPTAPASARQTDLRAVFAAPVRIERSEPVSVIPVEVSLGKLFVAASVNGSEGEFIFDTGSPTILSRAFADTLDLEIVGQNTGIDANGTPITMDIAVASSITLGSTVFHDVPIMVHDFSTLSAGACYLRDGVIGSELFPGSAWRIDLERQEISIAANRAELNAGSSWLHAPLYDFGYPHAPIIDYAVADISDKALFDTGADEVIVLFAGVAADPGVQARMDASSVSSGRGIEGVSAGGRGEITDLHRFTLDQFTIGETGLGRRPATTRSAPPTLIGARILATDIVTLDYPGGVFQLEARRTPEPPRRRGGSAIAYGDGFGEVVQLFDGSAAQLAGLRLGDHVLEISGQTLVPTAGQERCDLAIWLVDQFDSASPADLVVDRDGNRLLIHIPEETP